MKKIIFSGLIAIIVVIIWSTIAKYQYGSEHPNFTSEYNKYSKYIYVVRFNPLIFNNKEYEEEAKLKKQKNNPFLLTENNNKWENCINVCVIKNDTNKICYFLNEYNGQEKILNKKDYSEYINSVEESNIKRYKSDYQYIENNKYVKEANLYNYIVNDSENKVFIEILYKNGDKSTFLLYTVKEGSIIYEKGE